MSSDKKMKARREAILKALQDGQELTGSYLAEKFKVSRGTILNDIGAIRRMRYPVQVSSMRVEDGMYQAVYELPKYRMKS